MFCCLSHLGFGHLKLPPYDRDPLHLSLVSMTVTWMMAIGDSAPLELAGAACGRANAIDPQPATNKIARLTPKDSPDGNRIRRCLFREAIVPSECSLVAH